MPHVVSVEEAVAATGCQVSRLLEQSREQGADAVLRSFAEHWRALLRRTDIATGCPVLAVATEAEPALVADGRPPDRGGSLGRLVIASLEGAVAVSRAERWADPLDEVVAELSTLLAAARR